MSKIAIIGLGFVGKSYCYSIINKHLVDEIVLIDPDTDKLKGNYLDLSDSATIENIKLSIGTYDDINDCDIITITAGRNQEEGQTRLDLINNNEAIIKSICDSINKTNFNGIVLVATNPLDVCTYLVNKFLNLSSNKIIGSGTFLDTIRLKNILKNKYNIENNSLVIGEHGDSSLIIWSDIDLNNEEKNEILETIHKKAYEIISLKGETSFGIGSCLSYITYILLNEEEMDMPVSVLHDDICISNIFTLSNKGAKYKGISLNDDEKELYNKSKEIINNTISNLEVI